MSDEGEWGMIPINEKLARQKGVPILVPVPRSEYEGLAEKGMTLETTRRWISEFLANAPAAKSPAWRAENAALVASFDAFVSKGPLLAKAQEALAQNDFKKAISTLKLIASVDPNDHLAKLNLASALANSSQHAAALKYFEAVRATFAGDADFHVSLGHLYLSLGDKQKSAEEMALALEANPSCKPAMDVLVKLGVLVPIYENPRDAASLSYLRADGVLDYLTGEWDSAPRDPPFFLEQLAYHEAERRHEVALAAADRALAAGAAEAVAERARMGRIAALRALGRREEAQKEIAAQLEREPDSAWARVELARCLMDEGKLDEGRVELDRALELDPNDQAALLMRFWPGDSDIGRIQACIPALAAFAEAHPSAAGAFRSLARAKIAVGSHDEAAALLARAVSLAPGDDEIRAEHWSSLDRLERHEEVIRDAATLPDLTRRDWKLRWNEAEAYRKLGKLTEARAAFSAINFDESLHVDVRKRAKRAVVSLGEQRSP